MHSKDFLAWLQPRVLTANPSFDFGACLQAENDTPLQSGFNDLFSLSPLTSPESTPPPSPRITPNIPLPTSAPDSPTTEPHVAIARHPLPTATALPLPTQGPPSPRKTLPTPSTKAKDRSASKKAAGHAQRRKKRANAAFGSYTVRDSVVNKYVDHANPGVRCGMATEESAVQSTGFAGRDDGTRSQKKYRLDELVGEDSTFQFQLKAWDGCTPTSVVDKSDRLVAVLAGHPNVDNWPQLHQQAALALEEQRPRCFIPPKKRKHRRGRFVALQCGVSHGSGQMQPRNMANDSRNEEVLNMLNNLEPFKRMAGFASACMASWAPDLYKYYAAYMGPLYKHDPSLKPVFPSCIFSAATYNFGPQTVCFKHRDFANLTFGWCAVWSLGTFDATKGGHMVLWDCHLVIQFPPGSLILLPSAIVSHSNTSIASHERRYSFALYTAGALFRWVSNGFQKAEDYYAMISSEQLEVEEKKNSQRWMEGLNLLPVLKADNGSESLL